jgi:hypothetical protein
MKRWAVGPWMRMIRNMDYARTTRPTCVVATVHTNHALGQRRPCVSCRHHVGRVRHKYGVDPVCRGQTLLNRYSWLSILTVGKTANEGGSRCLIHSAAKPFVICAWLHAPMA